MIPLYTYQLYRRDNLNIIRIEAQILSIRSHHKLNIGEIRHFYSAKTSTQANKKKTLINFNYDVNYHFFFTIQNYCSGSQVPGHHKQVVIYRTLHFFPIDCPHIERFRMCVCFECHWCISVWVGGAWGGGRTPRRQRTYSASVRSEPASVERTPRVANLTRNSNCWLRQAQIIRLFAHLNTFVN